jgi:hypothetical protein
MTARPAARLVDHALRGGALARPDLAGLRGAASPGAVVISMQPCENLILYS